MLSEGNARWVVHAGPSGEEESRRGLAGSLPVVAVDEDGVLVQGGPVTPVACLPRVSSNDPAYIFFTSGTSGVPKAVLGSQKGLSHFLRWQRETFGVGPGDRCSQLIGLSFDAVLRDVFLPLTSGSSLHLPDRREDTGSSRIVSWLEREGITVLPTVPSVAQSWLGALPRGRAPRAPPLDFPYRRTIDRRAGAALDFGVPGSRQHRQPLRTDGDHAGQVLLHRAGGPAGRDSAGGAPYPGYAGPDIEGGTATLRDRRGGGNRPSYAFSQPRLCQCGPRAAGSIRSEPISGRPGTTSSTGPETAVVTASTARWRSTGRFDDQVKIRGVRVEPAEVAAVLSGHRSVASCVVVPRPHDQRGTTLVAYVVSPRPGPETAAELRKYLSGRLPAAMIPSAFVLLGGDAPDPQWENRPPDSAGTKRNKP